MGYEMILVMAGGVCWWCFFKGFLSLLGAFLLGLALGYWLWNKYQQLVSKLERDNRELEAKASDLEKDAASLRYRIAELENGETSLKNALTRCESNRNILTAQVSKLQDDLDVMQANAGAEDLGVSAMGFVANEVPSSAESKVQANSIDGFNYGSVFSEDNLQIVEGIGPKTEKLIKSNNIQTWDALASSTVDDLQLILDSGGKSFRLQKPTTWPEQARLAVDSKWQELLDYQKFLDTGRTDTGSLATPAKIEKLATKILGFKNDPEDLKIVEGIGPKIEQLLKNGGIANWSDLAQAELNILQEILNNAGSRYRLANPETWSKQAELAAANDWSALKEYQDFLQGGNTPK